MSRRPVWRVIGASIQGTAHVRRGIPCQDAHACRTLSGGKLVVVVADGAGSAARADEGARCAVATAVDVLERRLYRRRPRDPAAWEELLRSVVAASRAAVLGLAGHPGGVRELATTLTCVVATAEWVATAQIGDGLVVTQSAAGELQTVLPPQRGEHANEATFLTAAEAMAHLDITVRPSPVRAIAVSTDGLLRLALRLPAHEPYAAFFTPLFAFAAGAAQDAAASQQLGAWLASERVSTRTDDDKTLVLAVRAPAARPARAAAGRGLGRLRARAGHRP